MRLFPFLAVSSGGPMLAEIIQYGDYEGLERLSFSHFTAWIGHNPVALAIGVAVALLFAALAFIALRSTSKG
jgi:hypothetical protein